MYEKKPNFPTRNVSTYIYHTQFHLDYMVHLKPINQKKYYPMQTIVSTVEHSELEYLKIWSTLLTKRKTKL